MSQLEISTRHLWCARCSCERVAYLNAMTTANRITFRGGPLRAQARCSLCLMTAREGSYALAVTFSGHRAEQTAWEEEYLDISPLRPLAPEAIPLLRDRIWSPATNRDTGGAAVPPAMV